MKIKIIIGLIITLLSIGCISAIYAWYQERNKPPISKTEYIKVPEIKVVKEIQKIAIPGPEKIITIEKKVIEEKIKLPDWFKTDTNKQAIATAVISPYEGKTNTIAVLDTKTGIGEIVVKQEPLSFMGFVNDKELYFKAGYNTKRSTEIGIGGRWLFLRVGNFKLGGYAEGISEFNATSIDGRASAGLIITY